MSVVYDSLKRLLRFKTSSETLADFCDSEQSDASETIDQPEPPFTKSELAHEEKHASVWHTKNIETTFGRDSDGYSFTAPDLDDVAAWIARDQITKDQFLAHYLNVAKAPEDAGMNLGKTDKAMKKILTGEIRTADDLASYWVGN